MADEFEALINTYLKNSLGISKYFLSERLSINLKANLWRLRKEEALLLAGIGNENKLQYDNEIRSDKIFWLDRMHNDVHENAFFDLIDDFVIYLNQTCYAGISSYEFHYALYEKGSFYKKHIDQFRTDGSRAYSMILYLNESWVETDGGQLKIYHPEGIEIISPENRKCVFFKSNELAHEVLLTNAPRLSITGWLKTRTEKQ